MISLMPFLIAVFVGLLILGCAESNAVKARAFGITAVFFFSLVLSYKPEIFGSSEFTNFVQKMNNLMVIIGGEGFLSQVLLTIWAVSTVINFSGTRLEDAKWIMGILWSVFIIGVIYFLYLFFIVGSQTSGFW